MRHLYVATSQAATVVTHAAVGRFVAPDSFALVAAKVNRLEVHRIDSAAGGDASAAPLVPLLEIPVFGSITALDFVRLPGDDCDVLVFTTARAQFVAIRYDAAAAAVRTVATGDLRDRIGRPLNDGARMRIDPTGTLIAVQFYDNLLKLVAVDTRFRDKAMNLRIPETAVRDLCFVAPFRPQLAAPPLTSAAESAASMAASSGPGLPTAMIAILSDDESGTIVPAGRPVLRVYVVDLEAKALRPALTRAVAAGLDADASRLLPVAPSLGGGVLVVSSARVAHQALPPAATLSAASAGASGASLASAVAASSRAATATAAAAAAAAAPAPPSAAFPYPVSIRATTAVTDDRFLLADAWGGLHLLALGASAAAVASAAATGGGGAAAVDADGDVLLLGPAARRGGSTTGSSASGSPSAPQLATVHLGNTVQAQCLAYLDRGYVFIGSKAGDHQLVQLLSTPAAAVGSGSAASPSYLRPVASYSNTGPIIDMAVIDMERQGQCQVVTASGVGRDGSLRVVRNGVGIIEQAAVELPGIVGMWRLRETHASPWDKYLVTSFASESRLLAIDGEEMEEVDLSPGWVAAGPTLYAGNVVGDLLIQVTPAAASLLRLGDGHTATVVASWTPAALPATAGRRITLASGNGRQILLSVAGGTLVLLEVGASSTLTCRASRAMPHEVASLDISPLTLASATAAAAAPSRGGSAAMELDGDAAAGAPAATAAGDGAIIAAVGLWTDVTVRLVALPLVGAAAPAAGGLADVAVDRIGGEIQSRNVLLATLEGAHYLFVSLGDGSLVSYRLQLAATAAGATATLSDKKRVTLGTQPVTLSAFSNRGATSIFAACDRPAIIFASQARLALSNVNTTAVTYMAPFHSHSFPDCLALASDGGLAISTVDEIRKLHVRTVPLGEQPRRITHHRPSRTVVVGCDMVVAPPGPIAWSESQALVAAEPEAFVQASTLRLFDDTSFDRLDAFPLQRNEVTTALTVAAFPIAITASTAAGGAGAGSGASSTAAPPATAAYVIAGTSFLVDDEDEVSRGRLLVFRVAGGGTEAAGHTVGAMSSASSDRRLDLVFSRDIRGGVLSLTPLADGRVAAGINGKVQVFRWGKAAAGAGAPSRSATAAGSSSGSGGDGDGSGTALTPECSFGGFTMVLGLDARGDFIVAADLMKSVALLRYRPDDKSIEEVAADPSSNYMTAAIMLDDSTIVGAEHHHNIFTAVRRNVESGSEIRALLECVGEYHVGEQINRFGRGSLVMLPTEEASASAASSSSSAAAAAASAGAGADAAVPTGTAAKRARRRGPGEPEEEDGASGSAGDGSSSVASQGPRPLAIYATASGGIGALITLPPQTYRFLLTLQRAMLNVVASVGGLSHSSWRSWNSERRMPSTLPVGGFLPAARNAIDGDVIETFLDLDRAGQDRVIAALNDLRGTMIADDTEATLHVAGASAAPASYDEVVRIVEQLARLH